MRRLLVLFAAFALSLSGCVTQPSAAPVRAGSTTLPILPQWRAPADATTYTQAQIVDAILKRDAIITIDTTDTAYTEVNHALALERIAWTRAFVEAERTAATAPGGDSSFEWIPDGFDCDKFPKGFTFAFKVVAGRAGVRAQVLVPRISVRQKRAFGGVPAGGNHALALIVPHREEFVVEPQTGVYAPLSSYPNRNDIYRFRVGG